MVRPAVADHDTVPDSDADADRQPTPATGRPTSPSRSRPTDEVVVKVTAVAGAVSWVQVTDSKGTVRFTGNLADGQARTFRDKKRLD